MSTIDATEAKLSSHEEICAMRYTDIQKSFEAGEKRMTRMEYLLYVLMATVLLGPGVAAEFVKKILGL